MERETEWKEIAFLTNCSENILLLKGEGEGGNECRNTFLRTVSQPWKKPIKGGILKLMFITFTVKSTVTPGLWEE